MTNAPSNTKQPRMTKQRLAILEQFQTPGRHLTADGVYDLVRTKVPNVSLGTVYRNLELLSRDGLIRKLDLGGSQRSYDGGLHRHYHVRCVRCGRMDDVSAAPFGDLDAAAADATEFRVFGHQLEFEGVCPDCNSRENLAGDVL
ncbi:MAG: transcriptional repressor [Planctomycetota bacterium]|nr:transcriptional repressor [Planctomycetota bacterium]